MKRKFLHIAMYRAMDFLYDSLKNPPEELIQFLSDLNPYIWQERTTADPAVQADFEKSMDRQNIMDEVDEVVAYNAIKNFLAEQCNSYSKFVAKKSKVNFAELFEKISVNEWKKFCKIILAEEEN